MKLHTWHIVAAVCSMASALASGWAVQEDHRERDITANWQRTGANVLTGFGNMYNLHVVEEPGAEYRYRGWFFGWACEDCNRNVPGYQACDAIFGARAKAITGPWQVWCGDHWSGPADTSAAWRPLFEPRVSATDGWHNGDPTVVRARGRWWMAYSSVGNNLDGKPYGTPGDKDGSILCIGGAVSDDGLHWTRTTEPILLHKPDLGGVSTPDGDAHEHGSYHRPTLLYEKGVWRLWFDYWAGRGPGLSMGYAENRGDFMNPAQWKVIRADDNPCLPQFPNPDVVRMGGKLLAYADPAIGSPHPWIARQITEAESTDGLHWKVNGHIKSDPDAPAIHVPEAFVHREGGRTVLDLFYATQIGGDPYNYRYDRIRVMRRLK